jgi:hypothetical protein
MRFLSMVKGSEDQGPPPPALMEAMGQLIEQAFKAGTLVDTGGLAPTSATTRVRSAGGRIEVLDGPFSEAKEVVGGYAIMELESKEKAIEAAKEFLQLHSTHWPGWQGECEIRQIFGPND